MTLDRFFGIHVVFYRQFLAWRRFLKNFLVLSVFDPLLWLYAMGIGVMSMFGGTQNYLLFVATGMVAAVISWSVAMDALIGTMQRLEQGMWRAVLATPTTLLGLTLGEAAFSATRGVLAAVMVGVVSLFFVDFPNPWGFLPSLIVIWFAGFALHCMCLCFTALARTFADFDFVWPLFLNPVFIFSGAFFAIDGMPKAVQVLVQFFPMAPAVSSVRGMLMGTASILDVLGALLSLSVMAAVCTLIHFRLFQRRMYE